VKHRRGALLIKKILAPLLYRHRPVGLGPARQYFYLDWLYKTLNVPGAVVEIGCNVGGTAALAHKMLRQLGSSKRYVCVDTFSGFVEEQFETDLELGNHPRRRRSFSANSLSLTRRVLSLHDAADVELIPADILELDPASLPETISACLIDVDLYQPVLTALAKTYPRLAPGGVLLVDDCQEETDWQARKAYGAFMEELGLESRIEFGMGVVTAP